MIINGEYRAESNFDSIPDSWILGDGVFETLRSYSNQTAFVDLHLERLALGATLIEAIEPDLDRVRNSIQTLLRNEPWESGRIRIIYGSDGHWLVTHDSYRPPSKPVRLATVIDEQRNLPLAKGTSYGARFTMRRRAIASGFDDALTVTSDGLISEASTSNVIALVDGQWVTPSLSAGCLPGITRRLLIENFGITERGITLSEFRSASAAALISSLREIHRISEIDGVEFAESDELANLQSAFSRWILGKLKP